jgi:hypothetical protein
MSSRSPCRSEEAIGVSWRDAGFPPNDDRFPSMEFSELYP